MTLELEQDERILRREVVLERVGWVVLTAFILAGLIGLLGAGPLSARSDTSPGGLVTVDYDAIGHHEADNSLILRFAPDAVQAGSITVALTGSWVAAVDIQSVSPDPAQQRATPGGLVLEFPVEGSGVTEVIISYRSQAHGALGAQVSVGDDSVSFTEFVLP